MKNSETGLDHAKVDPSLHFNGSEPRKPDWFPQFIECLQRGDYEAAELIRSRNVPMSDECAADEHDCSYVWCKCSCHSRVQFELEHPGLRSLAEVESEREAQMEDAA